MNKKIINFNKFIYNFVFLLNSYYYINIKIIAKFNTFNIYIYTYITYFK